MRSPVKALAHAALVIVITVVSACGAAPPDDDAGTPACGIAPLVFSARGDVVQGETATACARIERRAVPLDEDIICKACPYDPLRLIVRAPGVDVDVSVDDDDGALSYEPSHHNWADTVAATGAGATTQVRILYAVSDGGWDLELTVDDDETLLLPVVGAR